MLSEYNKTSSRKGEKKMNEKMIELVSWSDEFNA